ncbi:unnamed protein product [Cuscuta campestris]|uniref:Major facilitator superfamily (MFS) profile domain-containing protein n=1 Tax=Cuscuta campestris TaxID=132261 RepID=A0A484L7J5_9ASTE|nr:unnamed protein product [Cuscuta campestris]
MIIPAGATAGEPLSHVKYTRLEVILCYPIAVMAGFTYGYSQTFVGGLLNMPNFVVMLLGKKGYRKAAKAVVSNFCSYVNAYMLMCSASIPFGTTIGLILGRCLRINWGPKGRMRIGAAWVLAGSLSALAYPHGLSLPLFFLVIGLGIGIIIEAVPVLYKQISREDVHPRIAKVFNLAYYLGIVSALLVNYLISRYWPNGWRVTFSSVVFPAFMLILASLFLNRAEVNDPEESCMVLLRQHKGVFLHKTGFLLLAQFMGSSQLVFYGPMILESLNFGSYQQFLTPLIGSSIGSLVVVVVMLFVVPRHLRRPTFLISCVLICISQFCMWVLFHFWGSREHHFKSSIVSTIGVAVLIVIYGSYFVIDGPYGWTRKEYPKAVQGVGNTLETAVMRTVIGLMNLSAPFFICALKKWTFLYLSLLGFGYCLIACWFVHDH